MTTQQCPKCDGIIYLKLVNLFPPIFQKQCYLCGKTWQKVEKYSTPIFNPKNEGYIEC